MALEGSHQLLVVKVPHCYVTITTATKACLKRKETSSRKFTHVPTVADDMHLFMLQGLVQNYRFGLPKFQISQDLQLLFDSLEHFPYELTINCELDWLSGIQSSEHYLHVTTENTSVTINISPIIRLMDRIRNPYKVLSIITYRHSISLH